MSKNVTNVLIGKNEIIKQKKSNSDALTSAKFNRIRTEALKK